MAGQPEHPESRPLAYRAPGDVAGLLYQQADGSLSAGETDRLREALATPAAQVYLRQQQATRAALASLRDDVPVPAGQAMAIWHAHQARHRQQRRLKMFRLGSVAAAACVLVGTGIWLAPEQVDQLATGSVEGSAGPGEPSQPEFAAVGSAAESLGHTFDAQPEKVAAHAWTPVDDMIMFSAPADGELAAAGELGQSDQSAMAMAAESVHDQLVDDQREHSGVSTFGEPAMTMSGAAVPAPSSPQASSPRAEMGMAMSPTDSPAVVWLVRRSEQQTLTGGQRYGRPSGDQTAAEVLALNAVVEQWAADNNLQPQSQVPLLVAAPPGRSQPGDATPERASEPERAVEPQRALEPEAPVDQPPGERARVGQQSADKAPAMQAAFLLELTPTQQGDLREQLRQAGFEVADSAAEGTGVSAHQPITEHKPAAYRQRIESRSREPTSTQTTASNVQTILLHMTE